MRSADDFWLLKGSSPRYARFLGQHMVDRWLQQDQSRARAVAAPTSSGTASASSGSGGPSEQLSDETWSNGSSCFPVVNLLQFLQVCAKTPTTVQFWVNFFAVWAFHVFRDRRTRRLEF